MNNHVFNAKSTVISISVTSLLWATCQNGEIENRKYLMGENNFVHNSPKASVAGNMDLGFVQDFSSATGTVINAVYNHQGYQVKDAQLSYSNSKTL